MIKSSFNITSSLTFRNNNVNTTGTSTTGVANIKNFDETINEDGTIQIIDDSKTLSSIINNIINIIDKTSNSIETYLINPETDITITESDSYNTITIMTEAEFSGKNAIFSMF